MIIIFKKLLGICPKADYTQLVKVGVIIMDVPGKSEFEGGHISGA